jgi:trehalose utilization protein
VQIDTQRLRKRLIDDLAEIFEISKNISKGKYTIQGRTPTLRQRNAWARVAAYTAQVINSIAKGYDEKAIYEQLDMLDRMIREAEATEPIHPIAQGITGEAASDKSSAGSS